MLSQTPLSFTERHIFKTGPTLNELELLLQYTSLDNLISKRSRKYKELNLKEQTLTEKEWLHLLAKEPGLLRRPILFDGKAVHIGYDKEAILEYLANVP